MSGFILAVATLIGTIIGVGMFGLPYVAARVGLAPTVLYLIVLGGLVTVLHLLYGEVVLRTKEKHRLAGYAQLYLGGWGQLAASAVFFISLYLALLAYILIGGEFLSLALAGLIKFSPYWGSIIVAIFGFGVVFKGLKLTGFFETIMTIILLSLILGLVAYGSELVNRENLILWSARGDLFLPYGLILFALAGGSAIPEIRYFFNSGQVRLYKKAIIWGTLIPAGIYIVFTTVVVGISGSATSPEALTGLTPFLGSALARYGAVVGFLAVMTSMFTIGLNVKNSLNFDFKLSIGLSFFLTITIPLILFFIKINDFIKILSLTGLVLGGCEGVLILAIWSKSKRKGTRAPEYSLNLNPSLVYALAVALLLGVAYHFYYYL